MRKMFKEENLDAELQQKGFVIRPLLSDEEVAACRDIYQQYYPDTEETKYNTLEINDHHYRSGVSTELRKILEQRVFRAGHRL